MALEIPISTSEARIAVEKLEKQLKTLGTRTDKTDKEFKELESRLKKKLGAEKAERAIDELTRSIKLSRLEAAKLRYRAGDVTGAIKTMSGGIKSAVSSLFSLKAAFVAAGIAATAYTFKSIADVFFDVGVAAEKVDKALSAATGSMDSAKESVEFLRGESERLGLVFKDQVDAFKTVAAAAKGTALEGEGVREIYVAIAEASTALQLSTDETKGALLAISQMMSKGTVQAEELRGQLGERLPGAFQIAAKAMGVTTQELGKLLEGGKVVAEDFLPKFARALKENYSGAIDDASKTVQSNLNRLTNVWYEFRKAVMEAGIMEYINNVLVTINARLRELAQTGYLDKLAETIANVVTGAFTTLYNVVKTLYDIVNDTWRLLSAVPSGAIQYFKDLGKAAKEASDEIGKIGKERSNFEKTLTFLDRLGRAIIETFVALGKSVGEVAAAIAVDMVDAAVVIGKEFKEVGQIIWSALSFDISGVKEHWKNLADATQEFNLQISNNWEALVSSIEDSWSEAIDNIRGKSKETSKSMDATKEAVAAIAENLKEWDKNQTKVSKSVNNTRKEVEKIAESLKQWEFIDSLLEKIAKEDLDRLAQAMDENSKYMEMTYKQSAEEVRKVLGEEIGKKATKEIVDKTEDGTKDIRKIWDNFLEGIQSDFADSFVQMFDKGLSSWADFFGNVLAMFKRLIAQMIAYSVMHPVVANMRMAVSGTAAAGAMTQGTMGGLTQGGGLLGFIGKLGSGIGQFLSGALSTSWTGLQQTIAGWIAPNYLGAFSSGFADTLASGILNAPGWLMGIGSGIASALIQGISTGNWGGALVTGALTAIGGSILGPVGAMIGGLVGSLVSKFFGGGHHDWKAIWDQSLSSSGFFDKLTVPAAYLRGEVPPELVGKLQEGISSVQEAWWKRTTLLLGSLGEDMSKEVAKMLKDVQLHFGGAGWVIRESHIEEDFKTILDNVSSQMKSALENAIWGTGRQYTGTGWINVPIPEEPLIDKIKDWFHEGIAFSKLDPEKLKALTDEFEAIDVGDVDSLIEWFSKANQVAKTYDEITTAIDNMLNSQNQFQAQFENLNRTFDNFIKTLQDLGFAQSEIDKIEGDRVKAGKLLADTLMQEVDAVIDAHKYGTEFQKQIHAVVEWRDKYMTALEDAREEMEKAGVDVDKLTGKVSKAFNYMLQDMLNQLSKGGGNLGPIISKAVGAVGKITGTSVGTTSPLQSIYNDIDTLFKGLTDSLAEAVKQGKISVQMFYAIAGGLASMKEQAKEAAKIDYGESIRKQIMDPIDDIIAKHTMTDFEYQSQKLIKWRDDQLKAIDNAKDDLKAAGINVEDLAEKVKEAFRYLMKDLVEETTQATTQPEPTGFTTRDIFKKAKTLAGYETTPGSAVEEAKKQIKDFYDNLIAQTEAMRQAGEISDVSAHYIEQWLQKVSELAESKALDEIKNKIKDILFSAQDSAGQLTEWDKQFKTITDKYSAWRDQLIALGATTEELNRLEKLRNETLKSTQDTINEKIDDIIYSAKEEAGVFTELETQQHNINQRFDDWIEQLRALGATEEQVAQVEALRQQTLEKLGSAQPPAGGGGEDTTPVSDMAKKIDDVIISAKEAAGVFSDVEIEQNRVNREFDEWRQQLVDLGATTEELTQLETLRAQALENIARATIDSMEAEYKDIIARNTMTDTEYERYQITVWQAEEQAKLNALLQAGAISTAEFAKVMELLQQAAAAQQAAIDQRIAEEAERERQRQLEEIAREREQQLEEERRRQEEIAREREQQLEEEKRIIESIKSSWEDFQIRMLGASSLAPARSYEQVQAEYERLLAAAKTGGEEEYKKLLSYVEEVYLPFMKTWSGSQKQYRDIYEETMQDLQDVTDLLTKQPSEFRSTMDTYLGENSYAMMLWGAFRQESYDIGVGTISELRGTNTLLQIMNTRLADFVSTTRSANSYQSGTEYVPTTGWKYLHEGEAVIPKERNLARDRDKGSPVIINLTLELDGQKFTTRIARYGKHNTEFKKAINHIVRSIQVK